MPFSFSQNLFSLSPPSLPLLQWNVQYPLPLSSPLMLLYHFLSLSPNVVVVACAYFQVLPPFYPVPHFSPIFPQLNNPLYSHTTYNAAEHSFHTLQQLYRLLKHRGQLLTQWILSLARVTRIDCSLNARRKTYKLVTWSYLLIKLKQNSYIELHSTAGRIPVFKLFTKFI